MSEEKGLKKPVKLKKELSEMLGAKEMPRTDIIAKLWEHIKKHNLQAKQKDGKAEGAGKFIVADKVLLPIFKNTNAKSKSGNLTDLRNLKEGQTIDMMQLSIVIGANIE